MRLFPSLICLTVIIHCSYAPPVSPDKSVEEDSDINDLEAYMEYHRYLKEVVQALESDKDFRERLQKADEEDVRSGKIAEQLDFVNHNIRTKLDEIKRREMERLRHLATKQFELTNNLDLGGKVLSNEHLDHANPHTFEIEDLKKLIKKTTSDLEIADKARRQGFKEYEMQKEYEKTQKVESMSESEKKEYLANLTKMQEEAKHHKPLHHPGSKQQLEEVWEKQDHMDNQFDPKAFFMMHDVDGNGVWDADEVKALFIKELDKLYYPGGPNKDMHERAEEMERMREHVFNENDKNRDGLIDFQEFLAETQKAEFNQDEGWKSIDENQIYTQQEYQAFLDRRLAEVKYLQERGLVDAHGRELPGAQAQINAALNHLRQMQDKKDKFHGNQKFNPNPPIEGYHPQGHGQQFQGQQAPPGQYYGHPQGQYPNPQGQHPAQAPQGQYLQPQGQYQQPQGQYQQPQGQYQQPQGQYQQPQGQYQQPQGQYQQPQGQYQPPQAQYQPPQAQYQQPQGQYQQPPVQAVQGQAPQGQPTQGQVLQAQAPQAQNAQQQAAQPAQNLNVNQGQAPPQQGQASPTQQGQVVQNQGQTQSQGQPGQAPVQGQNQPQVSQRQDPPQAVPDIKH